MFRVLSPGSETPADSTTAAVLLPPEAGLKGEGPEVLGALSQGLGGAEPPGVAIAMKIRTPTYTTQMQEDDQHADAKKMIEGSRRKRNDESKVVCFAAWGRHSGH